METFFHGSSALFDKFDLSHILKGDGKIRFGYGVYLTSSFSSAAHYSGANRSANTHYVYTVLIPDLTSCNHIDFKQCVHPSIVSRAEQLLNLSIPAKATYDGKDFRKHLARTLTGKANLEGEKAASEFLSKIGVDYIVWPYCWRNRSLGSNIVVMDSEKIKITKIEQVELNSKVQLIPGSERLVKDFNI